MEPFKKKRGEKENGDVNLSYTLKTYSKTPILQRTRFKVSGTHFTSIKKTMASQRIDLP